MEKKIAHYDLNDVKKSVLTLGIDAFTETALRGMDLMGIEAEEGLSIVLSLQRNMLYKSMTTHSNSRLWQDVYHAPCADGKMAYIKVTLQERAIVIQFKEK